MVVKTVDVGGVSKAGRQGVATCAPMLEVAIRYLVGGCGGKAQQTRQKKQQRSHGSVDLGGVFRFTDGRGGGAAYCSNNTRWVVVQVFGQLFNRIRFKYTEIV